MKSGPLSITRTTIIPGSTTPNALSPWPGQMHGHNDRLSIDESGGHYCIRVHAAGFSKAHFTVSIVNDIIVIAANNPDMAGHAQQDSAFIRSFRLPENTDKTQISARFVENRLEVYIPGQAGGFEED